MKNSKLISKTNSKEKFIVVLFFCAFLSGSGFYIIHPVIHPSFLLGPFLIFFLPIIALGRFKDKVRLSLLLTMIVFLFMALCYLMMFEHEQTQLIDFYYLLALPCVLIVAEIAAVLTVRESGMFMLKLIGIASIAIIAGLLFEIVSGRRLVVEEKNYLYASFFNNPNDLATVIVCFIPITKYLLESVRARLMSYIIFYGVSGGFILITMSRAALVLFFIFLCFQVYSLMQKRGIAPRIFYIVTISLFFVYVIFFMDGELILLDLMKNSNETIAINAKRVWLFVYHINQDKSVGGRLEEYLFFIRNIIDIDALPGYGIKNYSHFFAGSTVMKLADVNPHSLIIEIILAFGIFGLFFLLIIGGIVTRAIWYVRKLNPNAASAFLVTAIYFVIATNIPSSVFRMPIVWFPLFFQFFLVLEQGRRS